MKKDYWIAAQRGRDSKGAWEQKLEVSTDGCCHAITSVAKDNYVIERYKCVVPEKREN